MYLMYLK